MTSVGGSVGKTGRKRAANGAPAARVDLETAADGAGPPALAPAEAFPLQLRLFGPLDVRVHGQPLPQLSSRKGRWALALLALRAGKEVDREWLAGTLWPE